MSSEFDRESSVMCRTDYPELKDDGDPESGIFFAAEAGPLPPLKDKSPRPRSMRDVVGESASMIDVYRMVDRVAATTCTVLITGESGTGKELVARAVHDFSARGGKPFVAVNCGAIPESLIESELFGHIRGAFTGAHTNSIGKIGAAQGGTLFLDEVGELPLPLQAKLLRALETKSVRRVGSNVARPVDVRIIAATNRGLSRCVNEGTFREDLYYRFAVVEVVLPPLRARREDIPLLAAHFFAKASSKGELPAAYVTHLQQKSYAGNVRELKNVIERDVLLGGVSPAGEKKPLPSLPPAAEELAPLHLPLKEARQAWTESFELIYVRAVLKRSRGNVTRAAELAGVSRRFLQRMAARLGIRASDVGATEEDLEGGADE